MEKINIAIVDDDLASRNLLKGFLMQSDTYNVVADFFEADSAIEWLTNNDVGILLCDMQMPGMTGVELIQRTRNAGRTFPIIAISGFDDFDYVRGCLVQGVDDYLLKHKLTQEELLKVLNKITRKYSLISNSTLPHLSSSYELSDAEGLNYEVIEKLADDGIVNFNKKAVMPIVINPDYESEKQISSKEVKKDINRALIDIIAQIVGNDMSYIIYVKNNKSIYLLFSFLSNTFNQSLMNTLIKNFIEKIRRRSSVMFDLSLSIASGSLLANTKDLVVQARELDLSLNDKFYKGKEFTFFINQDERIRYKNLIVSRKVEDIIFESFSLVNRKAVEIIINDIFTLMENNFCEISKVKVIFKNLCNPIHELDLSDDITETLIKIDASEYYENIKKCIKEIYDKKMSEIENESNSKNSLIVSKAKYYVCENYDKDISIENLAQILQVSYTYLSREFKKETNLRLVEYINKVRHNMAKYLITRQLYSMKEIYGLVGYRSYNYFFLVFKSLEGMTPNDYAANNCSK